MLIDFEFSGGYAYIKGRYHANTDELPKETAEKLIRLIESSGVLDLKQNEIVPTETSYPDVFSYRLSIIEGKKRISLSLNDVTVSASIHPLLAFLRELAMEQTGKDK